MGIGRLPLVAHSGRSTARESAPVRTESQQKSEFLSIGKTVGTRTGATTSVIDQPVRPGGDDGDACRFAVSLVPSLVGAELAGGSAPLPAGSDMTMDGPSVALLEGETTNTSVWLVSPPAQTSPCRRRSPSAS